MKRARESDSMEPPSSKRTAVVVGAYCPPIFKPPYFGYKRFLEAAHSHPRDAHIVFDDCILDNGEQAHDYYVDWDGNDQFDAMFHKSVTTLVSSFFPPFDADAVIKMMRAGKNWKKKPYYGMTDEEIKDIWSRDGLEARTKGTRLHNWIEMYYNGELPNPPTTLDWKLFERFAKANGKLKPFRTEWVVFTDNRTRLCGSIDMVVISPSHRAPTAEQVEAEAKLPPDQRPKRVLKVYIFDWKRSKKISTFNKWSRGYPPLDKLHTCNYNKYAMQLNVYKYIVENFYRNVEYDGVIYDRIEVQKLFIVVMHPKMKTYAQELLPVYTEYVETMFQKREAELAQLRMQPHVVLREPIRQLALDVFKSWNGIEEKEVDLIEMERKFRAWLRETHPDDLKTLEDWESLNPGDRLVHMSCVVGLYKRTTGSTPTSPVFVATGSPKPTPRELRFAQAAQEIAQTKEPSGGPSQFVHLDEALKALSNLRKS